LLLVRAQHAVKARLAGDIAPFVGQDGNDLGGRQRRETRLIGDAQNLRLLRVAQ
jgi:hypothetical protein